MYVQMTVWSKSWNWIAIQFGKTKIESYDNVYIKQIRESISIHERNSLSDYAEIDGAFPWRSFWHQSSILSSASAITCSLHLVIVHSLAAQMNDRNDRNAPAYLAI